MRTRTAIAAVAAALVATGCGSNSCPTESPKLSQVADCTARPGATVSYQLQLCPTCNQTAPTCDVDLSAVGSGDIFLDPKVEACTSANSCPPTCEVGSFACTFTAPTAERTYTVTVFDPATGPVTRTLTVSSTASPSCSLVPI